jgi:hypothetical protein
MLDILLNDALAHPTLKPEPENPQKVPRRQFFKTALGAGAALTASAMAPKDVLAGLKSLGTARQEPSEAGLWRDRVTGFVFDVFDNRRAQEIQYLISRTRVAYRAYTNSFHYYYAAPLVFVDMTISPEEVICGNGFELNRFPFYDVRCPCDGINDLNAFEIRRVTNAKEVDRFGCVLAPQGSRRPLEYSDHADYRETARLYRLNPDQFEATYKRPFRGKGRTRWGYQIKDKTQVGVNNKPVLDVLLSSQDI